MAAFRAATTAVASAGSRLAAGAAAAPCLRRGLHACGAALSAKAPGAVEQKLREEVAAFKPPAGVDTSVLAAGADGKKQYAAKIKKLADELVGLTLLEAMELTDLMKAKLGYSDSDLLFPGGFGGGGGAAPAAATAAAAPAAAAAAPAAPAAPPKEEKTHVDIKLKAFDQKNKIKVIKEVRGVTNLGLKEAKELVEGAPCTILQKVKKEDAAKMIEKLKAECGAEFELI